MAIQTGFSSKTTCSFENRPIGCVCKTGSKYASKEEIGLAVFETFRELLLAVLVLGLRLAVLLLAHLLAVLLVDGFLLGHSVIYGAHKQAHNKEKEIKAFLLSSNEGRKIIFERFSNGMVDIMLEVAWSSLEVIGGFLAHVMIG